MPKLKKRHPSYRLHKPSGRAVVTLNGHDHYLGRFGTPGSYQEYDRLIAEWLVGKNGTAATKREAPQSDVRICELFVSYLSFAFEYYRKNGRPTGEYANMKDAMRPVEQMYNLTPVADFGPRELKAVRQNMVEAGLSRKVINSRVNRIRRIFKWGVENQQLAPSILEALRAVAPLKQGRTPARETEAVKPVPEPHIEAVLPLVNRQVRAMIELQLATGMRPGEVVIMRGRDLDLSEEVWAYRPLTHKTEHHGVDRVIFLGPKAQEVLRPILSGNVNSYLFSPRQAVAELRRRMRRLKPKNKRKRKPIPRRRAGEHYTTKGYHHAIYIACKKAGVSPWGPNRLRHNAATRLRARYGLEAARVILGHRSAAVTEVYAEGSG